MWDFITVAIFGADYSKCLSFFQLLTGVPEVLVQYEATCANGILIPLVIAAKGFILWIINVIFVSLLYQIAMQSQVCTKSKRFYLQFVNNLE